MIVVVGGGAVTGVPSPCSTSHWTSHDDPSWRCASTSLMDAKIVSLRRVSGVVLTEEVLEAWIFICRQTACKRKASHVIPSNEKRKGHSEAEVRILGAHAAI